jgi:nucleoside-diphosphate-sugar epimerase
VAVRGLVAVTGATGTIGPAVVRRLVDEGWDVRAFARRPPTNGLLPEGVTFVQGELADEAALHVLLDGAFAVHHLAGRAHAPTTPAAAYSRVNVEGVRTIVSVARAHNLSRFVYYSSTSVYGSTAGGPPADEETDLRPMGPYAHSKAAAEQIVLEEFGDRSTVLRLAAVYGPRLKGNYLRLFQAIARGRYVSVGPGLNRRTVVFVDDVAAAAALVTATGRTGARLFNVTDGEIHKLRDIVGAIAAAAGKSPPSLQVPIGPVRVAARALDVAAALRLSPIPGTALLSKYLEDSAVRGDRIKDELGFRPAFGLSLGWRKVAEAMTPGEARSSL